MEQFVAQKSRSCVYFRLSGVNSFIPYSSCSSRSFQKAPQPGTIRDQRYFSVCSQCNECHGNAACFDFTRSCLAKLKSEPLIFHLCSLASLASLVSLTVVAFCKALFLIFIDCSWVVDSLSDHQQFTNNQNNCRHHP